MHRMQTVGESYRRQTREQVLVAHRTVLIENLLKAAMVFHICVQARIACLAVPIIVGLGSSTQATVIAVENRSFVFIIEQPTLSTEVFSHSLSTFLAETLSRHILLRQTKHAHHSSCSIPVDLVIALFVMTQSASEESLAALRLDATVSFVVGASVVTGTMKRSFVTPIMDAFDLHFLLFLHSLEINGLSETVLLFTR